MSTGSQNGRIEQAHLNEEWIRKYQSKSLAVEELQAGGRHLSECGTCRRVLLSRMGPVRLPEELAEIPEALHLSYEQITAYIDGKLNSAAAERVEAHTFICASCSREIADLRKLDAQLAEPALVKEPPVPRGSLKERFAQFVRMPALAREFGLAFGAVVAGIFLLLPGGHGGGQGTNAVGLMHLGSSAHQGLNLGAYALVIAGLVYMVYRFWRRR